MLRQPSSRSHRSKKLRASHGFQAFLLVAVAVWIVYQLTHPFGERRRHVAVEETSGSSSNDDDTEPARRRLGRMRFVRFPGHASVDDNDIAAGARSWSGGSSDDDLSGKAGGGEEGPEDDGDDADDGLAVAADEEDDGTDFQSRDGRRDDDPKAVHGGTHQNGLNISGVGVLLQ